MARGKYKRKKIWAQHSNTLVHQSEFSTRVANCLCMAGIHTLPDLDEWDVDKIKSIEGIGAKAMSEISAVRWSK